MRKLLISALVVVSLAWIGGSIAQASPAIHCARASVADFAACQP